MSAEVCTSDKKGETLHLINLISSFVIGAFVAVGAIILVFANKLSRLATSGAMVYGVAGIVVLVYALILLILSQTKSAPFDINEACRKEDYESLDKATQWCMLVNFIGFLVLVIIAGLFKKKASN